MTWNPSKHSKSTKRFATTLLSLSVVLALSACNGDDGAVGPQGPAGAPGINGVAGSNGQDGQNGADGQNGQNGAPAFPSALFWLSNNGAENLGTTDLIDQNAAGIKRLNTGGNEGIALDTMNNIVHAADFDLPSIRTVCMTDNRADGSEFSALTDREISGPSTGLVNPKGIHFAEEAGLIMITDFNGLRISVFGSTAAGDVPPLAETVTSARPWDLDYDNVSDRLFVALTDGTVAVYDNYVSGGFDATPARIITPSDEAQATISVNLHGIVYDRSVDRLVLSDVGDAAIADDGAIFVIDNASIADGNVAVSRQISGPATLLGNPVDIVLSGTDLRVAEKSNDAVLVFSNIYGGDSGDIAPTLVTTAIKPESLVEVTQREALEDVSDISASGVNFRGVVASSNPGVAGPTTGLVARFSAPLNSQLTTFDYSQSIESVTFDVAGDAYATFDDAETSAAGVLIANRVATSRDDEAFTVSRDRMIAGSNTGLVLPKGLDVASSTGLMFIAENNENTPAIQIFPTCASGNLAPVMSLISDSGARPWDVDYDPVTDKAFVALTNGTISVFDDVVLRLSNGTTVLEGQDRTIVPAQDGVGISGPTNMHGIDYDPSSDTLIVSDVGSAAVATDGKIYVLPAAGNADGLTEMQANIGGELTNLGNPVDIMFSGNDLYVAEKSNSAIMRFDNILNSTGGNIAPDASISFTAPESVSLIPSYLLNN